jgi:DNA sulfur modification protein DndD
VILNEIGLEDFRQFLGKQVITFSCDETKNITLVHGENGVGKTTLLNAILWCFYGRTGRGFEQPERLLSLEAEAKGTNVFKVEVIFEHSGESYRAVRFGKKGERPVFKVFEENGGNTRELPAPVSFINSVIPSDMAEHFFFHGESVIAGGAGGAGLVGAAIRDVLGFRLAELGLEDIGAYLKTLEAQARKKLNDHELDEMDREREVLTKAIADNEMWLQNKLREIERLDKLVSQYQEELRNTPDAGKLQGSRDQLEKRKTELDTTYVSARKEQHELVAKIGWALFATKLVDETGSLFQEQVESGQIPSPYNEQLVDDLLESGVCLCGRELPPGSEEYGSIMTLRRSAGSAELTSNLFAARSALTLAEDRATEASREFQKAGGRLQAIAASLTEVDQHLADIRDTLKGLDIQSISAKESALERSEAARSEFQTDVGHLRGALQGLRADLAEIERGILVLLGAAPLVARLKSQMKFLRELRDFGLEYLAETEERAKSHIVDELNRTLREFSRKPYKVELSDDYSLQMLREDDIPVAKSNGERLLLGLSFISCLISFAEKRATDKSPLLVAGALAPFVIDAPFGELDDTYKGITAEMIPTRARQVVLFLSSSHWKGTVENAIRRRVGKEYILQSHVRGPRGKKPQDEIELGGKKYFQSVYGADLDRTVVEEV